MDGDRVGEVVLHAAHVEEVAAVVAVVDRGERAVGQRRRVEGGAQAPVGAHPSGAQVEAHDLRVDPLGPKRAGAELAPVKRAVAERRLRADNACVPYHTLLPGPRVDRHEPREAVEVALERYDRRVVGCHRVGVCGIAPRRDVDQCPAVLELRQAVPVASQVAERLAQQCPDRRFVVFAQRDRSGEQRERVVGRVACHPVPDVGAVSLVRPGHELVSELVVVGDEVLVRSAEPFIGLEHLAVAVEVGAVFERERGLEGAPERGELCFGQRGVAFEHPDRHEPDAHQ